MRLARLPSLALVPSFVLSIAVVLAACVYESPGWTYQPAPSATPAPSGSESAEPSGSAAPSGSTDLVHISALGIKFEQAAVTAPASQPFQIEFENKDAGTPHDVVIHSGGPTGPELFKGEIFNGIATRVYDVPALDPGQYSFVCSVHPTMVGTLTAQ